jgi:uncharacterized protein YbjT (DUF2867 family)
MKIAITTPTGHVGSAVAEFLLDFGGDIQVKLLARRPDKLSGFVRRGAEMSIGSLDDVGYLTGAMHDVDALFWATPPGLGSDNLRAFQRRFGQAAATAVRDSHLPRVVNLSSIGAELDSGAGPINGLHDVEQLLNESADNVTHLRPGFFFENLLGQIDSIRQSGTISLPLSGSKRFPMIACRDIAQAAAQRLADGSWTGHSVEELHGPADVSFDDVAQILSEATGRKITFVRCDRQQARQAILDHAVSENTTDAMLELYDAAESGKLRTIQRRSPRTTTSTKLADFARNVMLPLLAEQVAR